MDVMTAVASQSCLDLSTELETQQAIQVSHHHIIIIPSHH